MLFFSPTIDENPMACSGGQSADPDAFRVWPRLDGLTINPQRQFSSCTQSRCTSLWRFGGIRSNTYRARVRLGLQVHTRENECATQQFSRVLRLDSGREICLVRISDSIQSIESRLTCVCCIIEENAGIDSSHWGTSNHACVP